MDPVLDQPVPDVTPAAMQAPQMDARTFLYTHALYGDPVFDRDVLTFQAALSDGLGAPAAVRRFGYNDRRLSQPTPDNLTAAIGDIATQSIDGQDLVVVMLTTHGSPEFLAQKPANSDVVSGISAQALRGFLAPLDADKQVIIIQACYSGSLIDDLASPNRIILTAAAADKSSFGCNPDNDNTWYVKSLNAALRQGGSWSDIAARTKAGVRALEEQQGIGPNSFSNPQSYVGRNMQDVWTQDSSAS